MASSGLARPFIVLVPGAGHWSAYVHVATGQGKGTRRRLIDCVHFQGPVTRESLPNVLRDIARALETPVEDR